MEYRILGPLEVLDGGEPLPLGTAKQQALLAVLLLHANEVVSRERLIDELWGERPPPTADKAVQVYVSKLRKTLTRDGSAIATRAQGYVLQVHRESVDATRFERVVAEARTRMQAGELEAAARLFRQALAFWRGKPLAGLVFESEAATEIERLEHERLSALMDRIDCDLALGRHAHVLGELDSLVRMHPLQERLRGQLMLALYRAGRQADALAAYREGRETLVEQLGIEPSPGLQRLEKAILMQDPALEAPAGVARADAPADPSGTVTFLFTDIEGSTRLERHLRDRYGAVLAEHQAVLRSSFAQFAGREIDTQGDSFFVVFSRAKDAVAAAVTAQRSLETHDWPDDTRVRVRMGIHTGEAAVSHGRYVGLAVHRAARIAAAAHGGQILVSATTRDLVEDDLPPDQRLVDVGEHRLKDLPRPERLFQLNADGLPSTFPPLGTVDQQHLADAAEAPIARPAFLRRPRALGAFAALAVAAAVLIVGLAFDRSPSPLAVAPNSVAIIDPASNDVVGQIALGARPTAIAAANDIVWIGTVDGTVTRIDARARAPGRSFGVGATPTGLAVGRGAVWVAHGKLGTLRRIDLRYGEAGEPLEVATTRHLALDVGAVAVGPLGVWAAFGDGTVAQVDAAGTRVVRSGYSANVARALAVGERWVWVVNRDGSISRVNPTTATPLGREVSVGRGPSAIVTAHDAQWVTAFDDDAVSRLEDFSLTSIRVGDGPVAIAAGRDTLWVANANDGTVSRIDPAEAQVVGTIDTGQRPTAVAVAGGAVWVAVGSR